MIYKKDEMHAVYGIIQQFDRYVIKSFNVACNHRHSLNQIIILIMSNHDRHGCTKISYWLLVLLRVSSYRWWWCMCKKSIIFVKEEKGNRKKIFEKNEKIFLQMFAMFVIVIFDYKMRWFSSIANNEKIERYHVKYNWISIYLQF